MASKEEKPEGATASEAGKAEPVLAAAPALAAEEYPDPDEDDLDDLDDVLDQFSSAPSASGPGRPAAGVAGGPNQSKAAADTAASADSSKGAGATASDDAPPLPTEADAEAFAAQLQKEMAALMGEIDNSPSMQKQLDAMMAELSTGVPGSESKEAQKAAAQAVQEAAKHAASGSSEKGDATFQETIRRTMERMQASGEQAAAAANEAGATETDMLEALLKEMATAGGNGDGEEEFSKMLLGMMEQLTNKEILYEPMKDLNDKFPNWLKENEGKADKADYARYLEQQKLVQEIVARFEREGYNDENPQDREFIVERMQKMQAAGSPPADLVGDMKETQDALGDLDAGCPQQ